MHPLTTKYCTEITPTTVLTNKTGQNGFVITADGRIYELTHKYSHDIVICMLFWDDIKDTLNNDKVNLDFLASPDDEFEMPVQTHSPFVLGKYTYNLPAIRITERHSYGSNVPYYDLWFVDESLTKESFAAFKFVCRMVYGLSGYEEVDGPNIDSVAKNINTYTIHMKNIVDGNVIKSYVATCASEESF